MIIAPRTVRDGITLLGKIEVAKNIGHGWRVIVNAGTEPNPLFRLFAVAEFGKARDLAEEFKRSDKLEGPAVPVSLETPFSTLTSFPSTLNVLLSYSTLTVRRQFLAHWLFS